MYIYTYSTVDDIAYLPSVPRVCFVYIQFHLCAFILAVYTATRTFFLTVYSTLQYIYSRWYRLPPLSPPGMLCIYPVPSLCIYCVGTPHLASRPQGLQASIFLYKENSNTNSLRLFTTGPGGSDKRSYTKEVIIVFCFKKAIFKSYSSIFRPDFKPVWKHFEGSRFRSFSSL